MKCPCCKGTGELDENAALLDRARRREIARIMREKGHTLTYIMNSLGYKSPRSVVLAINRND